MRFGFVLDEHPPAYMMPTHLTIKCAWCGLRRLAGNNRNAPVPGNTICKDCADKLIHAKRLYRA